MVDTLEFNEIYQEVKGSLNDGRLWLNCQGVIFKNSKHQRWGEVHRRILILLRSLRLQLVGKNMATANHGNWSGTQS